MEQDIDKIRSAVFVRRPVLKELLKSHGKETLLDYVRHHWQLSTYPADELFIKTFFLQAAAIHGESIAKALAKQLAAKPLVSTVDHHGIWGHPIFVNSDLIYSLAFDTDEYAIALSTESISLNNTSSWSGSLLYHHQQQLKRYSFFPDKLKTLPVISAPAIGASGFAKVKKSAGQEISRLIDTITNGNPQVESSFSLQASQLTTNLWQQVFPSAPKLFYIPLESLVLKYLTELFKNSGEFLSQIVLTQSGRKLWEKYFGHEHTFLFWGITSNGHRMPMKSLPQNILELMQAKKVYPSSPLCFAALLRAGMVCVGGFTQTTWLTRVKNHLAELSIELSALSPQPSAQINLPTKNFAESSLAWLKLDGKYIMPSAVDLYFTKQDLYEKYKQSASKLTLEQSINLAMPTIYSIVVPKGEQVVNVAGFNQPAILENLNLTI